MPTMQSSAQTAATQQVPDWFYQNKPNTPVFLYGTGQGHSVEQAKTQALNSISSSIVVTVSGEIETTTKMQGGNYSQNVSDSVKVELSKIKFPNPQIEKQAHVNNRYYVLVKVSKAQLYETVKEEFDTTHASIVKDEKRASAMHKLDSIYLLRQMMPQIQSAQANATILSSLDSDFDAKTYLAQYAKIQDQLQQQQRQLNIKIEAQNKAFGDSIASFINSSGFRLNASSADVIIVSQTDIRMSEARGWLIAKATVNLKINTASKTLNSLSIQTTGRSSSSIDNAVADAADKFEDELQELGIETILFQDK